MPSATRPVPARPRTERAPAAAAALPAAAEGLSLYEQPGHLIRRAHQVAVSLFHEAVGRDVTPVQYAVLSTLLERPGIDQVTLAAAVALDTSTTADIAARLEAKGWIRRDLLPRRQRALSLTAEGQAMLAGMAPGLRRLQQALLEPLDAAEQAELLRLLRKFVHLRSEPAAPDQG